MITERLVYARLSSWCWRSNYRQKLKSHNCHRGFFFFSLIVKERGWKKKKYIYSILGCNSSDQIKYSREIIGKTKLKQRFE